MRTTVCITGAAGGLGKAFAIECASRGWDVFLTDLSEEALVSLSEGLKAMLRYVIKISYLNYILTRT